MERIDAKVLPYSFELAVKVGCHVFVPELEDIVSRECLTRPCHLSVDAIQIVFGFVCTHPDRCARLDDDLVVLIRRTPSARFGRVLLAAKGVYEVAPSKQDNADIGFVYEIGPGSEPFLRHAGMEGGHFVADYGGVNRRHRSGEGSRRTVHRRTL